MDVERSFVSKVLTEGEITAALDAKISVEFFEDDQCARVWEWILDFWMHYAKVPGKKSLAANYPNFKVIAAEEPLEFYIDKLNESRTYAILEETVSVTATALKAKDIETAKATFTEGHGLLHREVSALKDINLTENADERIERYDMYRNNDGALRGLPTGFRFLDYVSLGLQPEQLITYIGLPKAGKSTMLLLNAMAVQNFGKRSGFVSFEMSNEEQEARYDAFNAQIDWRKLMAGTLGPKEWARLKRTVHEGAAKTDLIFMADRSATTTVSGLAAKAEQYKPDVLFVDGVYLMQSELSDAEPGTPQALTDITRNLKRLCQRLRIPIVITTQVLPGKYSQRRGLTMDTIGYTSSFAQDSDLIVGVDDVIENGALVPDTKRVKVVTGRNVRPGASALIQWDWENGSFEEMEDESYDGADGPDDI